MRGAVFYEIFVERFCRGLEKKDNAYINLKWGEKPTPKSFAGGDIPGITKNLDYIQELGVNALYLTPIFQSDSNHKYDIYDYHVVDERFGTNTDLEKLIKEAHKRGIRVVLDAVFNHCSEQLSQFQDVVKRGKKSPYFDWFIIRGKKPEKEPLNYEVFAFCDYMPKFNTSNPEVQEFLLNIAVSWVRKYDIDGWRLDVSDEVSHDFWRLFRKRVKEVKPECVIIGENWHDANPFLQGDQYDSIMNYSFTKACLDYFARGSLDAEAMAEKLNANLMRNMEQVNVMMLNLLDSHDTHRFFTEVGCDKKKLLAALALEIVFIGTPCIYYGTEICMEGGYDPDSRRCFDWDQEHWDQEVLNKIKVLITLKKEETLQYGNIRIWGENELLYVQRKWKRSSITLCVNETDSAKELAFGDQKRMVCVENGLKLAENLQDGSGCIKERLFLQSNGFVVMKEEMGA